VRFGLNSYPPQAPDAPNGHDEHDAPDGHHAPYERDDLMRRMRPMGHLGCDACRNMMKLH
jgi:hypothetical protein